MNLKHLRYFLAVAEEKSFIRAAHRVHIEPSPLSKAVKALESQLGVHLLYRNKGSVQLTGPGKVLEEEARNIIAQIENAKSRVYSASKGFKRRLRIGLTDGLLPPQLAELLARSREEEPATEIRIHNMAFHELYPALRRGQIDMGFTLDAREHPEGVVRIEAWRERPAVALPIRHPLLFCEKVSFHEALHYPLITYHPERCAGAYRAMKRWLGKIARGRVLPVAEYVLSHEQMLLLVAAGYGIAFGLETWFSLCQHPHVIIRPVEGEIDVVTFMVVQEGEPSPDLANFMRRVQTFGNLKNAGERNNSHVL